MSMDIAISTQNARYDRPIDPVVEMGFPAWLSELTPFSIHLSLLGADIKG